MLIFQSAAGMNGIDHGRFPFSKPLSPTARFFSRTFEAFQECFREPQRDLRGLADVDNGVCKPREGAR